MTAAMLEARATLRRPHLAVASALYVVAVLLVSVRTYSGAIGGGALYLTTADDGSRYLVLLGAALLGTESGASWYATGRAPYAWVAGVGTREQLAHRIGVAAALGAVTATTYWLLKLAAAFLTLALNSRPLRLVNDEYPLELSPVWRVAACAIAASVLGALVGCAVRRPKQAAAVSFLMVASLLPVTNMLATRVPAIASVQSYLPSGAFTTLLESNGGLPRETGLLELRSPRSALGGAAIVFGWAALLYAVALAAGVYRADVAGASRRRLVITLGWAITLVVALGLVLPPLAREALPWSLRPEWLRAKREHASSIDVVASFVGALRSGAVDRIEQLVPDPAAFDPNDSLWKPLTRGDPTVGSESEMDGPERVPVVATVSRGDEELRVEYEFDLRLTNGKWQILRVSGAIAEGES